ncbi:type I restriction enzyme, S subunit [Pseudomonas sp. ok272]|uniref:restriction endonuclease subunit S n=1 Tax=unclassified Pseudomonas TaxID=196821 RepID=UPI0008D6A01C|nr:MULTISPECIES: restriction endonuclease subunit S [unclassified Pseudomonas]SEN50551.1 type I restriction enzyme, S subunit [Pseudomonas sp. ok272]SFN29499.1 type I restriction enzyme, S subunit [Pseudomonas sp. ok602]
MTNTALKNTSVMKRFSDVARIVTGKTPATSNRLFFGGHIPFVTPGDLDGEDPIVVTKTQLTAEGAGEVNQLPEGSVLVSCIGSLGKIGIAGVNVCTNQQINALVFDKTLVEPRYGYHFCKTLRPYLEGIAPATTLPIINKTRFSEIEMPLRPLPEQRRIASILDKADALRAKRRETIAKLDQLLQSVFLEMFGDPATNPKGWPVCELGDLIHAAQDGPHVSPEYSESGIPFLSTRHVRAGSIRWEDLKYLSQTEAEIQWRKCRPERGDILYTKGGTTGLAATVETDEPFAVWVHVALLKTNFNRTHPKWLTAMLNSKYCFEQSQRYTHGIANRDLGLKRMVKIKMYLPPLEMQRRFAEFSQHLARENEQLIQSAETLDKLFSSFQNRAFTGCL